MQDKTVLDEVFGVSNTRPLSYVERLNIDSAFRQSIRGPNPVVIYGASKQGKTALVSRYLPYNENIVVRLTPKTQLKDIYQAILRQSNIEIEENETNSKTNEGGVKAGIKWTATIPFFASTEANSEISTKRSKSASTSKKKIPFNLELPQDIGELLLKTNTNKFVILENFHYLTDENQKSFAFDLRTFQEIGIKFIILGVWKEKNRMLQYNGDLLDRISEIPVEPWTEPYLFMVAREGEKHLNIKLGNYLLKDCSNAAFGSIGVFQELLRGICEYAKVTEKQTENKEITDQSYLEFSIKARTTSYEGRHKQSLISFATGIKSSSGGTESSLFLPYYFVRVLLEIGYEKLRNGISRIELHEAIRKIHHRPNDVRPSDMSNLLHNLSSHQAKKSISPPYSITTNTLNYSKSLTQRSIFS